MVWNFLSIHILQRHNRWSLGMDTWFHPSHYWSCDYLSMPDLIQVDKTGRQFCHCYFIIEKLWKCPCNFGKPVLGYIIMSYEYYMKPIILNVEYISQTINYKNCFSSVWTHNQLSHIYWDYCSMISQKTNTWIICGKMHWICNNVIVTMCVSVPFAWDEYWMLVSDFAKYPCTIFFHGHIFDSFY